MLRIIETYGKLPNTYSIGKNVKYFLPGMIAQLFFHENADCNRLSCEVSGGLCSSGIIDDIKTDTEDSTKGTNRITVWVNKMVFVTDQFDMTKEYTKYAKLYCNNNGLFTTDEIVRQNYLKKDDDLLCGIVLEAPTALNPTLTALWL